MKKILIVFGTRPEAIKMAPIIRKMRIEPQVFQVKICVTSQHREMLDQVLNIFEINPDYDLNIMKKDQNLFNVTADVINGMESILKKEKPDVVLVQGDTTSTFTASLAAYYFKIKVGHVVAGLRTDDKFNPFTEEINRRLTDCLADIYFVPTEGAKNYMIREGIKKEKIFKTGNTVIDALLMIYRKQKDGKVEESLLERFKNLYGIEFNEKRTILITGHRRESFGKDFENICLGLKKIADHSNEVQLIYPVHLNPNVQESARKILSNISNVHLIEPLDYFSFVWLMRKSYLIMTDSGGIQEEAPSLGKPVLVMRNITERPEGLDAGTAKLVGTSKERIYEEASVLLNDVIAYKKMARAVNPYGDGKASKRICEILDKAI